MKKYGLKAAIALACIFAFSGCEAKYPPEACEAPIKNSSDRSNYFYLPDLKEPNFNGRIEADGVTFYCDEGLKDGKFAKGVDAALLVKEKVEIPQTVFVTAKAVTHINEDGFWVNPDDGVELIGAVAIEALAQEELPFGIFAGVSANLFEEERSFTLLDGEKLLERVKDYAYALELQYPLYTRGETTKKERETAWSFAYALGAEWLKTHTVLELAGATADSVNAFAEANGAALPKYYFSVGDYYYSTQIRTENLRYYFSSDYDDSEFNEKEFSLQYSVLTEFVKENEKLVEELSQIYGHDGFASPVSCYMGNANEFNMDTLDYSSLAKKEIACYTAGRVASHLVRFVADGAELSGYTFDQNIRTYFALQYSTYALKMEYLDYSLRFKDRYIARFYTEGNKDNVREIRNIYNETFGKCTFAEFTADRWIQSIAYKYGQGREDPFIFGISFIGWVYENYGFDGMMEVNRKYTSAKVNGKDFDTLVNEWNGWLKGRFE